MNDETFNAIVQGFLDEGMEVLTVTIPLSQELVHRFGREELKEAAADGAMRGIRDWMNR